MAAWKIPMTLVCEIFLYLLISFCVYVAQTQSLSGTCCLTMLLHLRHCLDRVHSGPKQYVVGSPHSTKILKVSFGKVYG